MRITSSGVLFVGVDGGASRCRARLCDMHGEILSEGEAGSASLVVDIMQARQSIMESVSIALHTAGLSHDDHARCRVGLGLAGAGRKALRARFLDGWRPFATIRIDTDAHIAWLAAHGGGDGAVIILGTGSVGYGVIGGRRHVLGGWGMQISDEASAAAIGREAIRRSIWAWDGRVAMTLLSENILGMYGGNPAAIVAMADHAPPASLAAFAPLVFQFAESGDIIAAAILEDAAGHVIRMVDRLRSLGFARIALMGGIAVQMLDWLPEELAKELCLPREDAVAGALLLARQENSAS